MLNHPSLTIIITLQDKRTLQALCTNHTLNSSRRALQLLPSHKLHHSLSGVQRADEHTHWYPLLVTAQPLPEQLLLTKQGFVQPKMCPYFPAVSTGLAKHTIAACKLSVSQNSSWQGWKVETSDGAGKHTVTYSLNKLHFPISIILPCFLGKWTIRSSLQPAALFSFRYHKLFCTSITFLEDII